MPLLHRTVPNLQALPILTFHAIDGVRDVLAFSPELFRRGISSLRQGGFESITLNDAAARIRDRRALPADALAVTFDDGYRSVYEEAFPVLQQERMQAVVFLAVGRHHNTAADVRLPPREGRPMLSWSEIRELHRHGIGLGAHTLTHPDLTRLDLGDATREIVESKRRIEDAIGAAVTAFAYPFGRYDRRIRDLVGEHFECACSDRLGIATSTSDPYALERVDAYYLRHMQFFRLMRTPLFGWYVRARNVPRRVRRALS